MVAIVLGGCAGARATETAKDTRGASATPAAAELPPGKRWVHYHPAEIGWEYVRDGHVPAGHVGEQVASYVPVYECPCRTEGLGGRVEPWFAADQGLGGFAQRGTPEADAKLVGGRALVWVRNADPAALYRVLLTGDGVTIVGDRLIDIRGDDLREIDVEGRGIVWAQIVAAFAGADRDAPDGREPRADGVAQGGAWGEKP